MPIRTRTKGKKPAPRMTRDSWESSLKGKIWRNKGISTGRKTPSPPSVRNSRAIKLGGEGYFLVMWVNFGGKNIGTGKRIEVV